MKKVLTLLIVSTFAVVGSLGAADAGSKRKRAPAVTSSATGMTVVGAAAANGEAIGGGLIVGKSKSTANQAGQSGYASTGGTVEGSASSTQTGGGGMPMARGGYGGRSSETSSISFGGSGNTEAGVN